MQPWLNQLRPQAFPQQPLEPQALPQEPPHPPGPQAGAGSAQVTWTGIMRAFLTQTVSGTQTLTFLVTQQGTLSQTVYGTLQV